MPRERLTALDASFLFLERPSTHMHIAALSVFDPSTRPDGRLRFQDVAELIASRIHLAPGFRRKVVEVPLRLGLPVWVDDPEFDLERHVHREAVPPPGGRRELTELAQRLLSTPLDRDRPLWELSVLEGLEGGHVATLMKVHHALMDGVAGMQLASAMYDLDTTPPPPPPAPRWHPEPEPTPFRLIADALGEVIAAPARAVADAARTALSDPAVAAIRLGAVASGVRSILELGARPASALDARVRADRRLAITEVPFQRIREVKEVLGGTVNDVVLTAVAGGLHRLLRARRQATRGRSMRILVPVSVRAGERSVGNRIAPAFVDVPVGAMSAKRRLVEVRAATRHFKDSMMASGSDAVIGLGGYAPAPLVAAAARALSLGPWFNVAVSNIPAPQQPMYLAGARLVASYPCLPLGPTSALSIGCTSLGGTMAFGLVSDRDAVPDLDVLALALDDALAELAKAAGR